MKNSNLLVPVKHAGQTTKSLQGEKPWRNRLENLEVSRQDQVWVADITYVRLNGRFIYVCLLMDVFTRMIRAWQISQHLTQSLTLKPLEEALCHSVPEIHHSDQGVQYLSKAYIATLQEHRIEISVAQRGAVELKPNYIGAYYNRGMIYSRQDALDCAIIEDRFYQDDRN